MTHADFIAMNLEIGERIVSEVGGHELTNEGVEEAGEALRRHIEENKFFEQLAEASMTADDVPELE